MSYHISFHETANLPNEPLKPLGHRAITSIALPPAVDAATASLIRHQINEALAALLEANVMYTSVRAVLD